MNNEFICIYLAFNFIISTYSIFISNKNKSLRIIYKKKNCKTKISLFLIK
jgi:hypothetical protein